MKRTCRPLLRTVLALGFASGCSADPGPLSPTPDQDPARAVRASLEMKEVARRNREAEASFFRRAAASEVVPEDRINHAESEANDR